MRLEFRIPTREFEQPLFRTVDEIVTDRGTVIPAGTETDGASVPRLLVPLGVFVMILAYINCSPVWLVLGGLCALSRELFPYIGVYFIETLEHDYLTSRGQWNVANAG